MNTSNGINGGAGGGEPSRPPQETDTQNLAQYYHLEVRQHPVNGKVAVGKEKDRKPIDPPPIIQLTVDPRVDPQGHYLQSPYFFSKATLVSADDRTQPANNLSGLLVSSLHKLKDTDNKDGAFFVFGDLSVKQEGKYYLIFELYEMRGHECLFINTTRTTELTIYPAKTFPGMAESTFLTRSFSDQGVRLRLRKDSRTMTTRKRNSAAAHMATEIGHQRNSQRARLEYDGSLAQRTRLDTTNVNGPLGHPTPVQESSQSPRELSRHNSYTNGYSASYETPPAEPRYYQPQLHQHSPVVSFPHYSVAPVSQAQQAMVNPIQTPIQGPMSAVSAPSYGHGPESSPYEMQYGRLVSMSPQGLQPQGLTSQGMQPQGLTSQVLQHQGMTSQGMQIPGILSQGLPPLSMDHLHQHPQQSHHHQH
jgi:hypothetical protein